MVIEQVGIKKLKGNERNSNLQSPRMSVAPQTRGFVPHPLLKNSHLMTLAQQCQYRNHKLKAIPAAVRWFNITSDQKVMGYCHWQTNHRVCPTVILIHGLEGSSSSSYMLGITSKAWKIGFNVIRLNLPGIDETGDIRSTLSDSDFTKDLFCIIRELSDIDEINAIWLVGYSMGGNLVLRMAGEEGHHQKVLKGIAAVSPTIDPACSIQALENEKNWIYNTFFVRRLKSRLRKKAKFNPEQMEKPPTYDFNNLSEFVEEYTSIAGRHRNTLEYYEQLGAKQVLDSIHVPTLILTAQDDPLVPFDAISFQNIENNPWITLIATRSGGHCSFIQTPQKHEDTYWAENRVVEFLASKDRPSHYLSPLNNSSH